jgi:NAD(P)-dependent dehydrogenase (short-subunit alcohol dehydrogenase family)
LRDYLPEIRRQGAELVIVGNGSRYFASTFREELGLDCPLLVDPELQAYRAAGLRRGRVEILSPRVPLNAVRAFWSGARQHGVHGDPWQLGGVFVIRPGGELVYRYLSREAGDHAPIAEVLAALAPDASPIVEETPPSALARATGLLLTPAVDPLIPLSFGAPGFAIRSLAFEPRDLDVDLSRRRIVLTGATAGLGFEAALALADLGAELELVCRDETRGEHVAQRIREATGNERVRITLADVSSLAAVRDAALALASRPVDALIHNAGLLPASRLETEDGLELTFATHVAGPFLLTRLLRPALAAAGGARVVWVSSGGMYSRRLDLADYNWERRRPYDGVVAYAETKRAQVVLAEMWADELGGDGIVVNSMHPGWADTPGVQSSIPRFRRVTRAILRTPAQGADTIVWLAASDAAGELTGEFVFDRKPRLKHLLPTTRESDADRGALWRLCERLTTPFVA